VKILLTADLHFHLPWFDWLYAEAENLDVVAVAGDMFDLSHQDGMLRQLIYFFQWLQLFSRRPAYFVFCSGNHDVPAGTPLLPPGVKLPSDKLPILRQLAAAPSWQEAMRLTHRVLVDNDAKLLRCGPGEMLAVSCLPYSADGRLPLVQEQPSPWLVLHHEPPAGSSIAAPKNGNPEFTQFIRRHQPDWTISGHVHQVPEGQNAFAERIGRTLCFNCRQLLLGPNLPDWPNHILIDTQRMTAVWRFWEKNQKREIEIDLAMRLG
jgi:predicted phosphohydrolase